MPNRRYTRFSQSKIGTTRVQPKEGVGGSASVNVKQGFCKSNLPGQASNGFSKMKAGVKKVSGYAQSSGL